MDSGDLNELMQFQAAELLIKLREEYNATDPIVNHVVKCVDNMFDTLLSIIQKSMTKECGDGALCLSEILQVVQGLRGCSVFQGLHKPDVMCEYFRRHVGYVAPVKEVVLGEEVLQGNKLKFKDIHFGYWIPFLPALEQLLSSPEVLKCVQNPRPVQDSVFTSPLDGYYYQNHPIVKNDPFTLGIGTYTDGVEMTDTCSSKSNIHGVTFIYWTCFNIYSELNSSTETVFLLAVVKTSVLKQYGYERFLKDFVDSMNKLYEGVHLNINGVKILFHALFLFSSGDNPASAHLAGCKESHFAEHPCRQCMGIKEEMFKYFEENLFEMRSMQQHSQQVQEVEQYNLAPQAGVKDPSVAYGINRRSVFMDIKGCDVTKCFPQDLMHDTIEGTLKLEICLLLNHVLQKGSMSLATINDRIRRFSKHFGVNKPSKIEKKYIDEKRLRQSAAETLNLAATLPFALRKWNMIRSRRESVCDEANLECYILGLQKLDLLMSRVLTLQDVNRIRSMTKEHHHMFQRLYPNSEIPKLHYEIHQGTHILLYGPPTQQWCMRFERKHAYFKRLLRIVRSFKNHTGTFAKHHQRRLSGLLLLSAKGTHGPFLTDGNCLGAPTRKVVKTLPCKNLLLQVLPDVSENDSINQYKVCTVNGVRYKKGCAVVTAIYQNLPLFGEIVSIFSENNILVFIVKKFITLSYEKSLNAFKVKYVAQNNLQPVEVSNLVHNHHLPFIKSVGATYIVVPRRSFVNT